MRRRIELIVFLLFAVVLLILAMTVQTGAEEAAVPAQSIEMPAEDPLEGAKIDAALDWHYIEDCTLTAYCACSVCRCRRALPWQWIPMSFRWARG